MLYSFTSCLSLTPAYLSVACWFQAISLIFSVVHAGLVSAWMDRASLTLRALVDQQEEQVRLLEELNSRKIHQVSQIQERLREVVAMVRAGQAACGEQQRAVDAQQQRIEELKKVQWMGDTAEFACMANASAAMAGATAAARAGATGPVIAALGLTRESIGDNPRGTARKKLTSASRA